MNIRLTDESLSEIKKKIYNLISICKNNKVDPKKVPLKIRVSRGPINMDNGEWSKKPEAVKNLTLDLVKINDLFSEKNLNMGVLGYGDPKKGLSELIKWVKHNITPEKLKGEDRDLKITVNKCVLKGFKKDEKGKLTKSNNIRAVLILSVPENATGDTSDLENETLKREGYIGIKSWKEKAIKSLKNTILDKCIKAIATGDKKLSDKIGEVK